MTTAVVALVRRRHGSRPRTHLALLGVLTAGVIATATLVPLLASGRGTGLDAAGVSATAAADIPPEALHAYQDAANRWRIDWAILAAVGKVECDHGRTRLPGCNPPGTINPAGARGHMQFLGSTWRRGLGQHELEPRTSPPAPDGQGYATDGDSDGDADPWSWPDATHSAARYLATLGITDDPRQALYGYNNSRAYVERVLNTASTYRAPQALAQATYQGTPGDVPLATVDGITVHTQIAPQVGALMRAARVDGYALTGSGYRDPGRQIELRRQNCGTSQYAIYEMPSSRCTPPTARPGTSNHERGLAVDFSCNGSLIRSRSSACYVWLAGNARSYSLYNLPSEPWHWSVDGT